MEKRNRNHILIKLFIIFVVFLNAMTTTTLSHLSNTGTLAYAKDEKKEDDKKESKEEEAETEEDSGQMENIFDALSKEQKKLDNVLKSIEYNKQMQYIMTYTILGDNYLSETGYSNIYKDNNGWRSGAEKNLEITINTGYENVVDVDNPSNSAEEKEKNDKDKESDSSKDKEIEKKIKDTLTSQVTELYARRYGMVYQNNKKPLNNSQLDSSDQLVFGKAKRGVCIICDVKPSDYHNRIDVEIDRREKNETISFRHAYLFSPKSSFISKSQAKSEISAIKNGSGALSGVKREIKNEVDNAVSKGDLGVFLGTSQYFNSNVESRYKSSLLKDADSKSYLADLQALQGSSTKQLSVPMLIGGNQDQARKVYQSNYMSASLLPSVQKQNSEFKSIDKQWKDETKKKIKAIKGAEEYLKKKKKENDETKISDKAKNTKTLGWIPLKLNLSGLESKISEKERNAFASFVKAYDGGNLTSNGTIGQSSNKTRYLRANDILNLGTDKAKKAGDSASPYLVSFYPKLYNRYGDAHIGETKDKLGGNNLGMFAGMQVSKVDLSLAEQFKNMFKSEKSEKKAGLTKSLTNENIENLKATPRTARQIALATKNQKDRNFSNDTEYILGVDNYGNIITGQTLQVVVPYWQNVSIPEINKVVGGKSQFLSSPVIPTVKDKDLKSISAMYKGTTPLERSVDLGKSLGLTKADKKTHEEYLSKINSGDNGLKSLAEDLKGDNVKRQAIALAITNQTEKAVKEFNKRFVKDAKEGKELYLVPSNGKEDNTDAKTDEEKLAEFTEKDLLEKLRQIFEYGFMETLRLTFASFVISFYTSNVANFTLGGIFHTTTITESKLWGEIVPSLVTLLVSFAGVYLLVMTFKVLRRTMTIAKMFQQFMMLTLVLLIPTLVYTPLVNLTLNAPTDKILGRQLEQMSILDTMLEKETQIRKYDEGYAKLFGDVKELKSRKDDYIVKFYTTTHVDGFDINSVTFDELSEKNKLRNAKLIQTGNWDKRDLVSIDVSIYDLFDWAVDDKDTRSLFTYLEEKDINRYRDIGKYTEYSTATNLTRENIAFTQEGKKWKASDLYKYMYQKTTDEKISKSINSVYDITEVFRNRDNDVKKDLITSKEKENLVRDLAMTAKSRKIAFGDSKLLSPSSMALYSQYSNIEFIPESDIFGLESTIQELTPQRGFKQNSLDKDTFETNKRILNSYISNYSIVREIIGKENTNVKLAEFKVITLNMWFSVNKTLDIPLFPREYRPETVSFDSYMRMVYIPLKSYQNLEDKGLDNVGKYVSLRYHPLPLFTFLVAIIALILFGFTYVLVFYVVLLVLAVALFIYNYIIRNNYDNKAWLGSLFIIGTFAIAKLGLLAIWYGMSYYMNYTFTIANGETYSYVIIHSVIIIAYVAFMLFFVFKRAFKNVAEDFENLGANGFLRDSRGLLGSLKGMITGVKEKTLATGNSAGKSFGKGIDKVLKNEGQQGSPSKQDMKNVSASFSETNLKKIADMKSAGVKQNLEDINDKIEGVSESDSKMKSWAKNSALKTAKKLGLKGLARNYDNLKEGKLGLSEKDRKFLDDNNLEGNVLHSTADGIDLTSLEGINNAETGFKLANSLMEKGIDAKFLEDEGRLVFDSTKVNLDNPSERKAIFGNTIEDLMEETQQIDFANTEDIPESDENLYYHKNDDGTFSIAIGEDGISKNSVTSLLGSELFNNNFYLDEEPVKDMNGNYTDGFLRVLPKTDEIDVGLNMASIGAFDSTQRKYAKEDDREAIKQNKALNFNRNIDDDMLKDYMVEGMLLQDGRISYNSKNKDHVKAVEKMEHLLNKEAKEEYNLKSKDLVNLTSQTTKGGNNGYKVVTANTNKNTQAFNEASRLGLINPDEVKNTVYAGSKADELMETLQDVTSITKGKKEAIENFSKARNQLTQKSEQVLSGNNQGVAGTRAYLDKVINSSEKLGVDNEKFSKATNQYNSLIRQKEQGQVSESTYERQLEILKSNIQTSLTDSGDLSKVQSNALTEHITELDTQIKESSKAKSRSLTNSRNQLKDVIEDYAKSSETLSSQGITNKNAEKLIGSNKLNDLEEFAKSLSDVKVGNDGTITVSNKKGTSSDSVQNAIKTLMDI